MRWILVLALLGCALVARADFDYGLQPRQIADGVWLLEGSTENFTQNNGGNIVNSGFIVTDQGVLVIDSGPSKRYGEALRRAIARVTDKPVGMLLLTHHHPDHVPGLLEVGGRRLRLLGLRGHTGADLAILDETSGVLFAGDLLFYQRALTTPGTPGLDVWLGDLEQLQALPWKQIVPGHGPVASSARRSHRCVTILAGSTR
jgi:glyoxylase-like metal-dependent hydrolase (beta-lactamase superfamily II)